MFFQLVILSFSNDVWNPPRNEQVETGYKLRREIQAESNAEPFSPEYEVPLSINISLEIMRGVKNLEPIETVWKVSIYSDLAIPQKPLSLASLKISLTSDELKFSKGW